MNLRQKLREHSAGLMGPIVFVGLLMFVEVVQTLDLISDQRGALAEVNSAFGADLAGALFGFSLRVIALYLFFAVVLWAIETTFRVRRKLILYFMVVLYALSYSLLCYPQIFDEFGSLQRGVVWLADHHSPVVVYAQAIVILGFLMIELFRGGRLNLRRGLFAGGISAVLVVYFFDLQSIPENRDSKPVQGRLAKKAPTKAEKRNVIIISIDSLRPDAELVESNQSEHAHLAELVRGSLRFSRVISPAASAHPSFTSLFTANNPPHHGARHEFAQARQSADALLAGSALRWFKEAGYKVTLMSDDNNRVEMSRGSVIDQVFGSAAGIASMVLPPFFRSRMVFGLFNNPAGFLFLPEIRANAAFSSTYKLNYFTDDVRSKLRSALAQEAPSLFVIHTCALCWPGHLTYPYYPHGRSDFEAPYTYGEKPIELSVKDRGFWGAEANFGKDLYRAGVEQMRDRFLLPVIDELVAAGELGNSVIVIMSDHGENFSSPGELAIGPSPHHGDSLLFGHSSELATLMLNLPGVQGRFIDQTVGIIDILPTIANYLGLRTTPTDGVSLLPLVSHGGVSEPRDYYVETVASSSPGFPGQFFTFNPPPRFSGPEPNSRGTYRPQEAEDRVVRQKQLGIYRDNLKLVLYPTNYGLRTFLCDVNRDSACHHNLAAEHPQVLRDMLAKLINFAQPDIERRWLPTLTVAGLLNDEKGKRRSPVTDDEFLAGAEKDIGAHQWAAYQRVVELINRAHDFRRAAELIKGLEASPQLNPGLRRWLRSLVLRACAAGAFSSGDILDSLVAMLEREGARILAYTPDIYLYSQCAERGGNDRFRALVSRNVEKNLFNPTGLKVTKEKVNGKLNLALLKERLVTVAWDSGRSLRLLTMLRDNAPEGERERYASLVRNHPLERLRTSREAEEISIARNDQLNYEEKKKRLRDLYDDLADYQLADLDSSRFSKLFQALRATNPHLALLEASRLLNEEYIDLNLTFLLLQFLDGAIPVPRILNTGHLKVRELPWQVDGLNYESDIRGLEAGLAAVGVEGALCKAGSAAELCDRSRKISAGNVYSHHWRELLRIGSLQNSAGIKRSFEVFAKTKSHPLLLRLLAEKAMSHLETKE